MLPAFDVKSFDASAFAAIDTADFSRKERLPLELMLGIEFEFILAVRKDQLWKPAQHSSPDLRGQHLVHRALLQPMEVQCADQACREKYMWRLPLNRVGEAEFDDHSKWTVPYDCTVEPTRAEMRADGLNRDKWKYYSMELKSRILNYHKAKSTVSGRFRTHIHKIDFEEEFNLVLSRLQQQFNDPKGPMTRIWTNLNCGLHDHVGNARKGFAFQTVKRIMGIHTAHERALDSIHTKDRIGGSSLAREPITSDHLHNFDEHRLKPHTAYNLPMSHHFIGRAYRFQQMRRFPSIPIFDPIDWLGCTRYPCANPEGTETAAEAMNAGAWHSLIKQAPEFQALGNLQCAPSVYGGQDSEGHNTTINLENLNAFTGSTSTGEAKMTIEFRQHTGTLDFE